MAKRSRETEAGAGERTDSGPRLLKSAEVVKLAGITRQMLYTYATMGLITEAEKTPSGHKLFDPRVLVVLKLIRNLQETRDYTLRDLKEIFFK